MVVRTLRIGAWFTCCQCGFPGNFWSHQQEQQTPDCQAAGGGTGVQASSGGDCKEPHTPDYKPLRATVSIQSLPLLFCYAPAAGCTESQADGVNHHTCTWRPCTHPLQPQRQQPHPQPHSYCDTELCPHSTPKQHPHPRPHPELPALTDSQQLPAQGRACASGQLYGWLQGPHRWGSRGQLWGRSWG
jgi:hypothetical protein